MVGVVLTNDDDDESETRDQFPRSQVPERCLDFSGEH